MQINGESYRSIWLDDETGKPRIIDQTRLPYRFETRTLEDLESAAEAIRVMRVRGAPLIGATAAHGVALALESDPSDTGLASAVEVLAATRPTAINLLWALSRMERVLSKCPPARRAKAAKAEAITICDEDVATCEAIGEAGLAIIRRACEKKDRSAGAVNILTHCNAGWLATVDWGTALAPIYKAHAAGLPVHVWVDETRPRNQGASLTAFEMREQGIPHTVIVDNAGGHLMQKGEVDLVMVGSDRTTATGDVCNKIGTYLKALAAQDNGVPFYACLPRSTIDWDIEDGLASIPIEERAPEEVREMPGLTPEGEVAAVEILSRESPVANPAFDVTPARFVTGLVTEKGVFEASPGALADLRTR